jgi:hypothetical protein
MNRYAFARTEAVITKDDQRMAGVVLGMDGHGFIAKQWFKLVQA